MRAITKQAASAFITKQNFTLSNTTVTTSENNTFLFLHGNKIAQSDDNNHTVTIFDAGWQTSTTKERLNGLLNQLNLGVIKQIKGVWYFFTQDNEKKLFEGELTLSL